MNDEPNTMTASALVNSALIAELNPKLAELGILSEQNTYDIYDRALESLERMQAEAVDSSFRKACADARGIIEGPLANTTRRSKN